MTRCFAYIRVSTTKQREQSTSLDAQRKAIKRYAERHHLSIVQWFEESETAAKQGRSEFTRLLKQLRRGEAQGLLIHKIDRSARNLRDWADLAELMDQGIEIHFAAESIDMNSRGGRLSADIQAVVAADYIRNLREEALKGIDERYRQGLLPGRALLGYCNNGGGQAKTIDPVKGPLVRELFERYASGDYTLKSISRAMNERGLTNTVGGTLKKDGVSAILNNRFYIGLLENKRTGEVFRGVHDPLIPKRLFDRVARVLRGKHRAKRKRHEFAYRQAFICALCKTTLYPEHQKGHAYYRCHTKDCPMTSKREEELVSAVSEALSPLRLAMPDIEQLGYLLEGLLDERDHIDDSVRRGLELELAQVGEKQSRLLDLLIDDQVSKEDYQTKKASLSQRRASLLARQQELAEEPDQARQRVNEFLELVHMAS